MNAFETTLQIVLPFIYLWELLVAAFAWAMDRHARANRYLAWLLTLLAVEGFAQGQLAAAADLSQARPWTYALSALTLAASSSTLVVTFSLLRPESWPETPRKRWLWRLAHVLIFVPALLTLSDVLFGTRLFYTGLDPETYRDGFVASSVYRQGSLDLLVSASSQYVALLAALAVIVSTLRDPQARPLFRRRARWLLAIQLIGLLLIFGLMALAGILASVTIAGLFLAIAYALMLLRGLVSDRVLRRRLANVRLGLKLYAGLGASVLGLLIIGGLTIYSGAANRQLMNRTLDRQRKLASLALDINTNLFDVQNEVFAFHDSWSLTGFEKSYQGGFQQAQEIFLADLEDKLKRIDAAIAETLELDPDLETRTDLERIVRNVNAYELTILEMSDHMGRRGFYTSGQIGQMQEILAELQTRLEAPGLEALHTTLIEIDRQMKDFFLRTEITTARRVHELTAQQKEQVNAADEALLTPTDKIQLETLISELDDLFFTASSEHIQLQENRNNLVGQSSLTSILVSQFFKQRQATFDTTVEQLQGGQSDTTVTITGLVVLALLVGLSSVYFIAGQITHPVQALGETANQLGEGELSVRAAVHGGDEIGVAAAALNLMADRLQELLEGLERQVATRTHELERYSAYLEASTEVGRVASSILEAEELVQRVVELIRDRFGLYYVGLFLKDETGEWAVLQAGTGEAGRALLAREYRLHVGGGSIIGWCMEHGQARVAKLDEAVTVHLTVSELPDTRSEAAIPLHSRGQVRGALSVHHAEPGAFDPNTIAALQTVADQVAIALDNATLFTESLTALEVAQRSYGELSRRAWLNLLRTGPELGFRSDEQSVSRITAEPTAPGSQGEDVREPQSNDVREPQSNDVREPALRQAQDAESNDVREPQSNDVREPQSNDVREPQSNDGDEPRHPLSLPIKVGDDVIGTLDTSKAGRWTPGEMDMMQEIVAQLALALDNARLHQSTRTRAHREQLTAQITARMRETLDVETVLRTAVEEIYEALNLSELAIYLRADGTPGHESR